VSFSLGKSFGSTMVGRAVTLGLLDVDDLVARFHPPAESGLHPDVRVRHLLTMTSGGTLVVKPSSKPPRRLDDDRPPGPGVEYQRTEVGERGSPDGYGVSIEPGSAFYYDGAPADHLSNVISAVAGMPAHDFMMNEVVARLGCETFRYQPEGVDAAGNVRFGGSILVSCRDVARLGQLYLQRGEWRGATLIAPSYIEAATSPSPKNPNYGYLWWLNAAGRLDDAPTNMFYAGGARGQYCIVLRDHDLVIATMGYGAEQLSLDGLWKGLKEVVPA
jgi:CubicO group peptidase (beta-lactamase class C family)